MRRDARQAYRSAPTPSQLGSRRRVRPAVAFLPDRCLPGRGSGRLLIDRPQVNDLPFHIRSSGRVRLSRPISRAGADRTISGGGSSFQGRPYRAGRILSARKYRRGETPTCAARKSIQPENRPPPGRDCEIRGKWTPRTYPHIRTTRWRLHIASNRSGVRTYPRPLYARVPLRYATSLAGGLRTPRSSHREPARRPKRAYSRV